MMRQTILKMQHLDYNFKNVEFVGELENMS